jgi:hypothetical protein
VRRNLPGGESQTLCWLRAVWQLPLDTQSTLLAMALTQFRPPRRTGPNRLLQKALASVSSYPGDLRRLDADFPG